MGILQKIGSSFIHLIRTDSNVFFLMSEYEEGKGYPLQYSVQENSMDCIVHGFTKSQTRLSDFKKEKW